MSPRGLFWDAWADVNGGLMSRDQATLVLCQYGAADIWKFGDSGGEKGGGRSNIWIFGGFGVLVSFVRGIQGVSGWVMV